MFQFLPVINAPKDTMIPKRWTLHSAGYNFYAPEDVFIPAHGESKIVPLNIKAIMPSNFFLYIKIRSGLSVKANLDLACSRIIGSNYANNIENDGNISVKFRNYSNSGYTIKKGERCCQGIFLKYYTVFDEEENSNKRNGGFGSTGK